MRIAIGDAEHNVEMTQLMQESYADFRRRDVEFQAGKEVHLRIAPEARKLQPKLIGPFAVVCESVT